MSKWEMPSKEKLLSLRSQGRNIPTSTSINLILLGSFILLTAGSSKLFIEFQTWSKLLIESADLVEGLHKTTSFKYMLFLPLGAAALIFFCGVLINKFLLSFQIFTPRFDRLMPHLNLKFYNIFVYILKAVIYLLIGLGLAYLILDHLVKVFSFSTAIARFEDFQGGSSYFLLTGVGLILLGMISGVSGRLIYLWNHREISK